MGTDIEYGIEVLQLLSGEEARLGIGDLDQDNCGTFTCSVSCGYSCEITCNVSGVW
ncbi:hypothetical protein ACFWNK_24915 [Streptomyces sp. NPDC058417]|uniref:hypothetical protein n=1 Tax=unclassified Streptomyces TaxID=2593676 RepID=UPI00364E88E3